MTVAVGYTSGKPHVELSFIGIENMEKLFETQGLDFALSRVWSSLWRVGNMKDDWRKYSYFSSFKDNLILGRFGCLKVPVWYRFLQPILIIPFGVDIDPSRGKQIKKDLGVDVIYTTFFNHTVILAVVFPDDIKEET